MTEVFIALGSNIEPEHNLLLAVEALGERFELVRASPVYQSAPVDASGQPDFLNAAALVTTALSVTQCKQNLREIEDSLGRVRTADKFGPRTIDLDIVLYGDHVLVLGSRHIPDPDLLRYAHVAVTVAALQPERRHPETGETLAEIADRLGDCELTIRHDVTLMTSDS